MSIFGTDPKDQMIALLKDQLAQRDLRVAELEKLNTSLTDARAFALAYPRATVTVAASTPPAPQGADLRDVPFKPTLSRDDIEKKFRSA